jgi:hypothetical protein
MLSTGQLSSCTVAATGAVCEKLTRSEWYKDALVEEDTVLAVSQR